jgi:hypothetical protein
LKNTSIGWRQKRQIVEVVSAAVADVVDEALVISGLQKPELQRVLASGGGLQRSLFIAPYLAGLMRSYAVEFDPDSFAGSRYSLDPNDEQLPSAPPDIDWDDLSFTDALRAGEEIITDEERWQRLRETRNLYLNAGHLLQCLAARRRPPKALRPRNLITFDAIRFRGPGGCFCTPYIGWRVGGSDISDTYDVGWISGEFGRYNVSAIAGNY